MASKLAVISGMAFEANIARAPGIHLLYGLDPARLETAIENAIREGASALLSFGTAAGLASDVHPGTMIVAKRIVHQQQAWEPNVEWAARLCAALPEAQYKDIVGVDHPLTTAQDKVALRDKAAIADMESHRVARIALQYQLPFAAIRVVLDDANRTLPPAALVSVRADGTVHYGKLLGSLVKHPAQLAALLQLTADSYAARKSLLRCSKLLRNRLFAMDIG